MWPMSLKLSMGVVVCFFALPSVLVSSEIEKSEQRARKVFGAFIDAAGPVVSLYESAPCSLQCIYDYFVDSGVRFDTAKEYEKRCLKALRAFERAARAAFGKEDRPDGAVFRWVLDDDAARNAQDSTASSRRVEVVDKLAIGSFSSLQERHPHNPVVGFVISYYADIRMSRCCRDNEMFLDWYRAQRLLTPTQELADPGWSLAELAVFMGDFAVLDNEGKSERMKPEWIKHLRASVNCTRIEKTWHDDELMLTFPGPCKLVVDDLSNFANEIRDICPNPEK